MAKVPRDNCCKFASEVGVILFHHLQAERGAVKQR